MSTNNTYLAVFCGTKTSPRRVAWDALPESDRRAREREGIAAWKAWVERHQNAIVAMGGHWEKRRRLPNAGSTTPAITWELLRLCARNRTRPRPNSSRDTRTLRFSRATPSRSCPCCQYQTLSSQ